MTAPAWARHLPAGAAPAEVDLLAGGTLPRAWAAAWRRDPGRVVLRGPDGESLTAAELEDATARAAGRLASAGLLAGDRIVMSAASSPALVVAHVAALRMGLVVVPVNTAYRQREVAHIVRDSGATAAVVDDAERGGWMAAASDGLRVVSPEIEGAAGALPALDAVAPDAPSLICYTSGTTGAPKGAALSGANLLASARAVGIAWRWSAGDHLVLALPLFHAHGLCVGLHGTLLAGASLSLLPRFDVDAVLDESRRSGATLFFGVPTMYARMASSPRLGELASLRLCVSGSAPLPPAVFERIAQGGGQRILERYGMTETLMNVSNPYDGERRPGTVGFPLPGVEVRIAGGPEGEILLRGPNVFSGYWRNAEATAAAFDGDGWFRSGDVGALDDDGYLRIVGRSRELIISGGFNVYPREVEDVLLEHAGVREVAVVGTPSDEWGEVVTAYVVGEGAVDVDDVLRHARAQLAPYKCPRIVHLVEHLPRNALGKVLKHELAAPGPGPSSQTSTSTS